MQIAEQESPLPLSLFCISCIPAIARFCAGDTPKLRLRVARNVDRERYRAFSDCNSCVIISKVAWN